MNEILKKRIEESAINGSKHYDPNISKYSQGKQVGYIRGFNEGAEYALSHQWISVEDALPEANENVLTLIGGVPVIARGYHVRARIRGISHWMPIPKFEPMKKIDRIYSRHERNGKYYLIARIKLDGEFVIEEIEVSEQQYRTAKEGDLI